MRWLAALGMVLLLLPAASRAQGAAAEELWPVEEEGVVSATVGRGVLLTLPQAVERVALSDDKVARAQVISSREVLLTGLVPGGTTVFVWLLDGERLRYLVLVQRDLSFLLRAMQDIDLGISIEASTDGASVLVRGEVPDRRTAVEAIARANLLLEGEKIRVLDLLRYPGYAVSDEERLHYRLSEALASIDPRISVRRIQVGSELDADADSYVLEGRVRDVRSLIRAVTVAERQLGGSGTEVRVANDAPLRYQRTRVFGGGSAGGSGTSGLNRLTGSQPQSGGLSSQIARGLVVTSESGRVLSLLEVDEIPQVLVSIRVIEVDRTKAKKVGINWRFDNENVSLGSILSPQVGSLPRPVDGPPTTADARTPRRSLVRAGPESGGGSLGTNLFGAYIDKVTSVIAAIDFLEEKALARSVAEPNILTLSGEPAAVVVGGEVPIPTAAVNQVASVQGVFFQDFGVRLDVRPTVVDGGMIAIEASPSIIRRSAAIGVGDVPGFSVQSVQTTARVQAGESLVLGGLLTFEEGIENRAIPGLGWLPGVGRWRRKSRSEKELLFVITPQIVETPRSEEPPAPVAMPDLDAVSPPQLDWPDGRDRWRDEFEPQESRPDGVPPSFLPPPSYAAPPSADAAPPSAYQWDEPAVGAPVTDARPAGVEVGGPFPAAAEEPQLAWDEPAPELEPVMPEGEELWVVDAQPCLNLRDQPTVGGKIIECVPSGTRVDILGDSEEWVQVRLPDGRDGWVVGDYLIPILPDDVDGRLQTLTSERNSLRSQIDSAEAADQDLVDQLRRIQEEIDRIRRDQ